MINTGWSLFVMCKYSLSIGGGQPDKGAPGVIGHFHIDGQIALPE